MSPKSFSFVTPYGYVTIDEMYDFVDKAGISILDTIKAGTLNGAKMIHHEDEFGSLEKGKLADLLVVPVWFGGHIVALIEVGWERKRALLVEDARKLVNGGK